MPTETDTAKRACWPNWVKFIHHNRLESISIWVLEAAAPLALIGAQVVHFSSPLFRPAFSGAAMEGLVHLLENDGERSSFISYLREAGKS